MPVASSAATGGPATVVVVVVGATVVPGLTVVDVSGGPSPGVEG